MGNVAGEVLETAAEVALTAGAATAVRASAKGVQEVAEAGLKKATKELVEEGAEKAAKEATEKAAKEVAEEATEQTGKRAVVKTNNKLKQFFEDAKKKFDPKNATNKQKGNFGEIASADNMTNNPALKKQGYDLERIGKDAPTGLDDKIEKGIDGIYKNNTPPPKYVIDEAKYDTSTLSQKTKDGAQMSDDWIKGSKRLEKQVGPREAKEIEKAINNGEVEKVISKVDENGSVKTYEIKETVDANGNVHTSIGNPWP